MRNLLTTAAAVLALSIGFAAASSAAFAADEPAKAGAAKDADKDSGKDKADLPPFPADASVKR